MKILTLEHINWAMKRYRYIALRSGSTIIGINCAFPLSVSPSELYRISIFEDCYPITFSEYIRIKVPFIYAAYFISVYQYYACQE